MGFVKMGIDIKKKLKKVGTIAGIAAGVAALSPVLWFGYHNLSQPEIYAQYKVGNQTDIVYTDDRVCYTVKEGHERVLIGMGGAWERTQIPGPHCRLPFEKAYDVDVSSLFVIEKEMEIKREKAKKGNTKESSSKGTRMVTGDEGELWVNYVVQYDKGNSIDFLFNVIDPHKTVEKVSEAALRQVVARNGYEPVLTTDKERVREEATMIAQEILDSYGTGMRISQILLKQVEVPEGIVEGIDVRKKFHDLQGARQDAERYIENARKAYEKDTKEALGEKTRRIEEARGAAQRRINLARGKVDRFKKAFEAYKGPDLEYHMWRLEQETRRRVIRGANITVLDEDATQGMLQHLFHGSTQPRGKSK